MTLPIKLPSHIKMIGDMGQFYTVLTIEDSLNLDNIQVRQTPIQQKKVTMEAGIMNLTAKKVERTESSEEDVFICGRCKQSYTDLEVFLAHKHSCKTQQTQCISLRLENDAEDGEEQVLFLSEGEMVTVSMNNPPVEIVGEDSISNLQFPTLVLEPKQSSMQIDSSEHQYSFSQQHLSSASSENQSSEQQHCSSSKQLQPSRCQIPSSEPDFRMSGQHGQASSSLFSPTVQSGLPPSHIQGQALALPQDSASVIFNPNYFHMPLNDLVGQNTNASSETDNGWHKPERMNSTPLHLMQALAVQEDLSLSQTSEFKQDLNTNTPKEELFKEFETTSSGALEAQACKDYINGPGALKDQLLCMTSNGSAAVYNCQMQFQNSTTKLNNPEKKVFCTYCSKIFKNSSELSEHIRCHTGEKPFQCVICGRGFSQKSNVKKHMVTHKVWPKKPTPLSLSSEEGEMQQGGGNTAVGVAVNKQSEIPALKRYDCQYCEKKFEKHTEYKSHLKDHQEKKCYRCILPRCGQFFSSIEEYVDHTTGHKDMEYSCHVCPDRFSDLNDLNLHQYTHLTDKDTREKQVFECRLCKNKYTSSQALEYHMETDTHNYPCAQCGKEFSALRYLRKHTAAAHSEGNLQCSFCGKKFKVEYYLKVHKLIHTGDLPFSCNECGAKFNRKDKLRRHMLTHSAHKKFKCPFKEHMNCEKEFHRFDKLKLHIMTHGNIKPFKCDICGLGFTRKEHLKVHKEKQHSQSKVAKSPKLDKSLKNNVNTEGLNDEYSLPSQLVEIL